MSARTTGILYLAIVMGLAVPAAASDKISSWTEKSATMDFYNRDAALRWKNQLGDWRDADGVAQGSKPFVQIHVADLDTIRPETWDITGIVKDWLQGRLPNHGVMLMGPEGSGTISFYSREAKDPTRRPRLIVDSVAGGQSVLAPTDDTVLHGSTVKPLGTGEGLLVGRAMIKFDLSTLGDAASVKKAILELHTKDRQFGASDIGIFHPDPGLVEQTAPVAVSTGLAANYPGDRGLEDDPDVILFADFEAFDWASKWTVIDQDPTTSVPVSAAPELRFEPFSGKALQVVIPQGKNLGMSLLYKFAEEIGYEPEEIYMRYYLRLGETWDPHLDGGKLPGIAGTYGVAGWGGRRADGHNGWSMRGSFGPVPRADNPMHGVTPIGTYAYYADMPGFYGDHWWWAKDRLGQLERNRWYAIEQHVKMNTPGQKDGIMRAWVDGKLALERTDVMYRRTDALKVERIWMNVFHGGTTPAPNDYHLFIDNVVVAKSYIGPVAESATASQ